MDVMPELKPVELWGLSYDGAMGSARAGMAVRRAHWCSPVVIYENGEYLIDDDGETHPYEHPRDDRRATDWNSQARYEETPHA